MPIGITVEGANILTRSLIIYGQGAIRCHPYVQAEMEAVAEKDLVAFDRAFFGHLGHVASESASARSAWRSSVAERGGLRAVNGPAGPMFGTPLPLQRRLRA